MAYGAAYPKASTPSYIEASGFWSFYSKLLCAYLEFFTVKVKGDDNVELPAEKDSAFRHGSSGFSTLPKQMASKQTKREKLHISISTRGAPYGGAPPSSAPPYCDAPPPSQPYSSAQYGGGPPPSAPPYGGVPAQVHSSAPSHSGPYGSNSFSTLTQSIFPPGTDPNVISCFQMADQDGSGFIDDKELQKALSTYNLSFGLRSVHLLMYLFTNTNIRKIGNVFFFE
ncbi:calcium-binding protein CBP-like [Lycium barbarum]|uniref:calcium-binding protein CBP-like n=1 Tax=Lycium barbarum TaxID=112863 RepID=UPI00293F7266|nr:calcium-binding protein CBP-like [Lycium barbarum]